MFYECDLKKVFENEPWIFDNYLLVVAQCDYMDIAIFVPLNTFSFLVRTYNVPPNKKTEEIGKKLRMLMGDVGVVEINTLGMLWRD